MIAAMKPGITINKLEGVAEEVYKKHGFHKEYPTKPLNEIFHLN